MLRLLCCAAIGAVVLLLQPAVATAATVVAEVSLSDQTMTVSRGGRVLYHWKVSTARPGKVTPTGSWKAKWLSRHHRSSRYNNAPMPYSIFYSGNYAVHGTYNIKQLGRRASSGCVRLHPENAAILFRMAQQEGLKNLRIVVQR